MKQTAVEWLVEQIKNNVHNTIEEFELIVEQSKEIEKKQIIDAHGNKTKKSGSISNTTYILTGEEYYETTFNKDE
jgi:hypothetical protein